jgi:hypothetical protein
MSWRTVPVADWLRLNPTDRVGLGLAIPDSGMTPGAARSTAGRNIGGITTS